MKILVVDDDNSVRLFLQRLLTKKFQCQVLEAKDGREGLSLIQSESPDLALLDVRMPIIDGVEMLEAIRSDPSHATLPVIVMSAVGDQAQVARLIMLGISDYILKPLWSETVYKRVYDVVSKVKTSGQNETKTRIDISQGDREKVLVVDKDLNFRTFFNALLSGRFQIYDVETGAEGLELFAVHNPRIVCVGEGLTLLNERLLARKIRQVDKNQQAGVFLCAEAYRTNDKDQALFNGIIKKSFVPDIFLKEFTRVVLNEAGVYDTMLDIVRKHLTSELITATQQTIGVISTQEIRVLANGDCEAITDEVYATVDLVEERQGLSVTVGLVGSQIDVLSIAEKILGSPVGFSEGAADAFGELVNTIGGRIRTSIEVRGIKVEQRTPHVALKIDNGEALEWSLVVPFQTDGGQKYFVGVAVNTTSTVEVPS